MTCLKYAEIQYPELGDNPMGDQEIDRTPGRTSCVKQMGNKLPLSKSTNNSNKKMWIRH